MSNYKYPRFWDYMIPLTKFWGVFTSTVVCGVGVDIYVHHHRMGIYVILASLCLFFLEITWVITLFMRVCIGNEHSRTLACWNGILWIKDWKKTIIYVSFAFALILKPHHLWLSFVAGVMLIVLGILHFLNYWRELARRYDKEPLLDNQDDYCDREDNYLKFDVEGKDIATGSKDEGAGKELNSTGKNDTKLQL